MYLCYDIFSILSEKLNKFNRLVSKKKKYKIFEDLCFLSKNTLRTTTI